MEENKIITTPELVYEILKMEFKYKNGYEPVDWAQTHLRDRVQKMYEDLANDILAEAYVNSVEGHDGWYTKDDMINAYKAGRREKTNQ